MMKSKSVKNNETGSLCLPPHSLFLSLRLLFSFILVNDTNYFQ